MLDAIEKLLVLQDRDRKISYLRAELDSVEPQRKRLQARLEGAQASLEGAKSRFMHLESERKRLELEVEAKKQQIERYALQQFQTKKNDEYRALATEIDTCKAAIFKLEDQEIELMEQAEVVQKEIAGNAQTAKEARQLVERQVADLAGREAALKKELAELELGYKELEDAVADDSILARYKRLRKQRGDRSVVGIEHSVCGGCHMKLPPQVVITCQGGQEVSTCPNCSRILYYRPDMDLAVTE